MNEIIFIFIFLTLLNLYILINSKKLAQLLSLIDNPIKGRSLHLKPVPKIGGLVIFLNIFLIVLYLIYIEDINIDFNILVLVSSLFFFLIGYLDDYFDLTALKKFLLIIISLIVIFLTNENILIKFLYFETLNKTIYLQSFKYIFTIFCIYLLLNTFNMADGINGLSIGISIIWLSFLWVYSNNFNSILFFVILLNLLILLIFNLKNKVFIGNSGSYLLGGMISLITIYLYNLDYLLAYTNKKLYIENIFLLFLIPGLDCARLFFYRIFFLKKNFYIADKNHLHHILISKFGPYKSLIIYLSAILIPNSYIFFYKDYILHAILITIVTYVLIIYRYKVLKK